jgi:hypothetical protein
MPNVTVCVEGAEVVVRLGGLDQVFAMRSEVRVPVGSVTSVSVGPAPRARGLRAPGTAWPFHPGRIIAGTWRGRNGKEFHDVRGGERSLVVDLAEGSSWRRLVVEVAHPEAAEAAIRAAIQA